MPDRKPTGTACVDYTWHKGGDALYTCTNSFNDGKYAYNNIQSYFETWYHKINARWHTDTETWYMYQRQVPNIAGNVANPITPETGANGAFCSAGERTCFVPEVAIVNYTEREFNTHNYISIRNEFVDDIKGQRTGYTTKYSEHLISYGHWIGSTVLFRPEIRLEHSYNLPAYDLGTKHTQFVVARRHHLALLTSSRRSSIHAHAHPNPPFSHHIRPSARAATHQLADGDPGTAGHQSGTV